MNQVTLAVAVIIALFVGVFAVVLVPLMLRELPARQVLVTGVTGDAQVTDLTDTGNHVNDQPEVSIHLEVKPTDNAPFRAEVVRVLSTADVGLFERGRTVTVKYDPAHIGRVAIVPLSQQGVS
jgi:hypothetical protein